MTGQEQTPPTREALSRARDYAGRQEDSDYKEGFRRGRLLPRTALLDLGCGGEGFCRRAADAGARVAGVDASPAMPEIASDRVPEGQFHVADMPVLPCEEHAFDIVSAFNSPPFTDDRCAALVGAHRVGEAGRDLRRISREERVGQAAGWRAPTHL